MKDRVPGAPGQFKAVISADQFAALQNGEKFTITLTRDDQPLVEGTPYSKTAVLPDALAQALCPTVEDPTPADAFWALLNAITKPSVCDSWNDCVKTGLYAPAADGPNEGAWFGYAIDQGNGQIIQVAFLRGNNNYVYRAQRSSADGGNTWSEWEWENPPVYVGTEYLTTERWNGKPVYTKLIDCGKTTSTTYAKTAQTGLTSGAIIRHNAVNMDAGIALPYQVSSFSNAANLWVTVDSIEYVAVWCGADAVGAQVYCQIWYVKD